MNSAAPIGVGWNYGLAVRPMKARQNRRLGMNMDDQKRQEFEAVTRPLIEWLNANFHPHVAVVIGPTSAVLYAGEVAYTTHDYLRD